MKKSLILIALTLSSISFASASSCHQSVADQYLDNARGTRFDYMPQISKDATYLETGSIYDIRRQADVGPFSEDKLIFVLTGSIHSGWFSSAIIVNPETCEIEGMQEIESE
ncbi:hypothetical protein A9Q84_15395 [Halobacteriovorax marinus]|uniref:Lipoprotein n=1 Tax=Halobacteriovorax marinus TaxID=97084 RepID=A0A1Y5F499_9BACT|nr:hypothetical protein A9Q84_15395 [Halobacteriovorax marinus]